MKNNKNIIMKFSVAFVAVAIVAVQAATLTDEQKQKLKAYHTECAAVSGITHLSIEDAKSGKYANDPKARAHLLCVSKKIGLQNAAGQVQKDVVTAKLTALLQDEALAKSLVDKCAKDEATPEDTAYNSLKCYHENTPDHISLV